MRSNAVTAAPGFERLRLHNVRCFRDVTVPFDPGVTIIIGENGAGKTTIAEAMASVSVGEREGLHAFPLRKGARVGKIELFDAGAAEPVARWTTAERSRLPSSRYLFAYGRYRRVQPPEDPRGVPGGPELLGPEWDDAARYAGLLSNLSEVVAGRRTTTLFASDHYLLRDIGRHLVDLHRHRSANDTVDELWRALDASLAELGHALEGIRVVERNGRDVAVIRRRGLDLDLRSASCPTGTRRSWSSCSIC
jgi:energy-coupling factor transporter ATP-binding protein EcfA2